MNGFSKFGGIFFKFIIYGYSLLLVIDGIPPVFHVTHFQKNLHKTVKSIMVELSWRAGLGVFLDASGDLKLKGYCPMVIGITGQKKEVELYRDISFCSEPRFRLAQDLMFTQHYRMIIEADTGSRPGRVPSHVIGKAIADYYCRVPMARDHGVETIWIGVMELNTRMSTGEEESSVARKVELPCS